LVIAYMSIGEAEDYRYYWKEEWKNNPPEWLGEETIRRIVDAGFDGAYLNHEEN
jgi:endo-alpha-1,4-polygalactosaminidase (GH114 family)